jgi:hypothetical protein
LIQEKIKRRVDLYLLPPSKNVNIRIYKSITLPGVLYGCETWSITLKEIYEMGVFENRVLKRIFGQRRNEIIGWWRTLRN